MKRCFLLVVPFLASLLFSPDPVRADETPLRKKTNFDADWRFLKGDPAGTSSEALGYGKIKDAVIASSAGFLTRDALPHASVPAELGVEVPCTQPGFDDEAWRRLSLPHDWAIEGPFDQKLPGDTGKLPWQGVGWYRKHFIAPADLVGGGRTFLDIDGAMAYSAVWCNGKFVGGWPYGYASFELDLTPFLKPDGENVLAIRLDNPPRSSRWYPGSGIYRHVWLLQTAPVHVSQWGTAVKTPEVSGDHAVVTVDTTLENRSGAEATLEVKTAIYPAAGNRGTPDRPVAETTSATVTLPSDGRCTSPARITLPHPALWNLDSPSLYEAVTTISQNGHPVDRFGTTFGVREIKFTADNGFLLNGKRVPLQGVCDHHDLGALGAALNDSALKRQILRLKEFGCNAIRTSHNPPSPELLDLCDRLGMVVMDEAFDCWKLAKNPNDYHVLFADWHEKDLRALVRRDRNHPCVVLWSIGNEIPEQGTPQGPAMAAELTAIAHDEDGGADRSRPTTSACNNAKSGYDDFHKGIDVMGFNYKPNEYNKFRASNPLQPVISTESASAVSSRGFYVFPVSPSLKDAEADFQVSEYCLGAPGWATPPDAEFKGQDDAPFTGGEFVWTGFDYLGEPTPYNADTTNLLNFQDPIEKEKMARQLKELGKLLVPSRSSYFGIVDLAGFPKDRFYLYQARWRPALPMAHILPHWTWPERVGQVTPVHVFTSGDEAELFLNGQSLGRKKRGPREYRLRWDDVRYAPGEVRVIAYKDGKEWATDTVKTAGAPTKIALTAEAREVHADGAEMAFVDAVVLDKEGVAVPRADPVLNFSVSGPAEIVATDNGDATSHRSFQAHECPAFDGKCLVILRTQRGKAGKITVHVEADGLQAADAEVESF